MKLHQRLIPLLSLVSSVAAQSGIAWRTDYDSARAESLRDGKPLLICFNHDDEGASDYTAGRVYRHPRLVKELGGVVPLIASPCRHQREGQCPRFGPVTCADHQRVDRQAWPAVFGPLDAVVCPQHLILFPDGRIAWHRLGQPEVSTLTDALAAAKAALKKDEAHRIGLEKAMLASLVRHFRNSPEDWLRTRTLLAHAQPGEFPELFALLGADAAAAKMLDQLAQLPAATVEPLLASLTRKLHPNLHKALTNARLDVNSARRLPAVRGDAGAGIEIRGRLSSLGKPDSIGVVEFADGQERGLPDLRGRITVLWFFLPDAAGLSEDVARLSEFAAECKSQPVTCLALGASLDPETSLTSVRTLKSTVPAGTYRYDEKAALSGVTKFPTVLVLDPAGEVVYRGHSRGEHEALVRGMLACPAYREQLTALARR